MIFPVDWMIDQVSWNKASLVIPVGNHALLLFSYHAPALVNSDYEFMC